MIEVITMVVDAPGARFPVHVVTLPATLSIEGVTVILVMAFNPSFLTVITGAKEVPHTGATFTETASAS